MSIDTTPWGRWREVGDRVFVRRNKTLDMNAGLVLGEDRCLVIDTRGNEREGRELYRAVRSVTGLPHVVALTHSHFDHCFGTQVFADAQPGCEIWSHERCHADLSANGRCQRAEIAGWLRESGQEVLADEVDAVRITPPNRTMSCDATLDLGGRHVVLHHPGRGHTDHDMVVEVPDAHVAFVGDLVEQGAPPSFDHAYPLDWAATLNRLLDRLSGVVVPGHGDVVDAGFVARQATEIAQVADVARRLPPHLDDAELEWHAGRLAVGSAAGFIALRRAQEHLAQLAQL
ncbi:MBL fold metallo-hydrolase [Kineosporia succinea]|uniref:Glyoxylase-like metal-dependent hydrolase (Beta-lactamase superfamily II) n=1 Tax=Kineosporia succinea TaxID=84632 RepID=A0ABT9P177_9ACTN|nr:MBL fold metallo-hydrolase [Kineosporia succinea]MDP9826436.1 glyoxylase-like metal-dependent hydrolase (beta-lactamase superfamily II) [Kineosporia succinea]